MIGSSDILQGKILIVDDQPANVLLLEKTLRKAGYLSISSTTNPREVRALQAKEAFDLILLDIQMPGMDGFQVMDSLLEDEPEGYLPVLAMTAEPAHKLRALHGGAKDFVSKPFDIPEVLVRVHNMLEVRLLHLETKRLYGRLLEEQGLSERLLHNVLPSSIAHRLKGRPEVASDTFTELIADRHPEVTVLFADIVGFTKFSESIKAEALVDVLNELFTRFDHVADRRGLEKIKTIGDSYMAAAGLPVPAGDHAARAAHMALDMMEEVEMFNSRSAYDLEVRVGLDSGSVVAGVIGRSKFLYDLWGDVVNTASRMESQGLPGRIQLTEETRKRLGVPFDCEARGAIEVKGKGTMRTWFLRDRTTVTVSA